MFAFPLFLFVAYTQRKGGFFMLYEWWERYRTVVIAAGAVLLVALGAWLYRGEQPGEIPALPLSTPVYAAEQEKREHSTSNEASAEVKQETTFFVDVKGGVKRPGVYRFTAGERVAAAIAKAGGALPDADLDRVNLAQSLTDGSVVWVPKKGEALSPCDNPFLPAARDLSDSPDAGGKVNVNTATLEELMTIPGIGETRAKAILSYRQQHGAFRVPDDLKQVTGIGEKIFERIQPHIRVK
jgi:competence protein ComEA